MDRHVQHTVLKQLGILRIGVGLHFPDPDDLGDDPRGGTGRPVGAAVVGEEHGCLVDLFELQVHRDVEEHRPAPALVGMADGGGDGLRQALGLPSRARPVRDRPHQPWVVHLLEASHELLTASPGL